MLEEVLWENGPGKDLGHQSQMEKPRLLGAPKLMQRNHRGKKTDRRRRPQHQMAGCRPAATSRARSACGGDSLLSDPGNVQMAGVKGDEGALSRDAFGERSKGTCWAGVISTATPRGASMSKSATFRQGGDAGEYRPARLARSLATSSPATHYGGNPRERSLPSAPGWI